MTIFYKLIGHNTKSTHNKDCAMPHYSTTDNTGIYIIRRWAEIILLLGSLEDPNNRPKKETWICSLTVISTDLQGDHKQ